MVPAEHLGRLAAVHGVLDIFQDGLTTPDIAAAVRERRNERLDVSNTHPTDAAGVFVRGGYGLCSTTDDYLRFALMLTNGGELDGVRILGRKTVELMYTNHPPSDLLPFVTGAGAQHGWGFGLGSRVLLDGARTSGYGSVGEHGWPGAANTYFWVDPAEQLVGVLMSQYMLGYEAPEQDLRTLAYQAILH